MFEVRLYSDDADVALMNGADEVEEFMGMSKAVGRARELFLAGYYHRAIVVNDDEEDIYDTAHDEALSFGSKPLPEIAPLGPRQRPSSLAERVLA